MRVYCLSGDPNRPCLVVRFKTTTLMLDAGLELNSLVHFLPLVVGRDKTGQKQKMNSFVAKVGYRFDCVKGRWSFFAHKP